MNVKEKLLEAVGTERFSDDPAVLKTYSKDFSLTPPGIPNYIVKPRTTEQVQKVIQFANENLLSVTPTSSQVHFYGAAIPKQGGIVLDLSGMNRILEIDEFNRRVRIEAGVTWEQLSRALQEKGFRIMMPLLPPARRSVAIDYLEREVPVNTVYDYGEPLQSMEVVWPTGEAFRMGSASVNGYPDSPSKGANPSGPGLDFYRFLQGAQGTMGVVTWVNLKIEYQPVLDKILLAPVHDLDRITEFLYRILRLRIGQECLILNNIDLAAILAGEGFEFEKMRASLPPWTLVLVMSAMYRHPEEKLAYEEEALRQVLKNEFPGISLETSLPGFPGADKKLLSLLRQPWPADVTYWKNRYKGGCQSLLLIARPDQATSFIRTIEQVAPKYNYPIGDIGIYVQPIEHNRACQVEFDLFYNPNSAQEVDRMREFYRDAARALLEEGALFTRPYGELASMVYEKATGYVSVLRRVKKTFDPNNIMNPGNLCF